MNYPALALQARLRDLVTSMIATSFTPAISQCYQMTVSVLYDTFQLILTMLFLKLSELYHRLRTILILSTPPSFPPHLGTSTPLHLATPERRRPHLVHPLLNCRQRQTSAQNSHILPFHQLNRHPPHHSLGQGTVIRVWNIPSAEKLYQFRRGTREAMIYSMNVNPC